MSAGGFLDPAALLVIELRKLVKVQLREGALIFGEAHAFGADDLEQQLALSSQWLKKSQEAEADPEDRPGGVFS